MVDVVKNILGEMQKDKGLSEKICHECFKKKTRRDVDLCYSCAKKKFAISGYNLTMKEYRGY